MLAGAVEKDAPPFPTIPQSVLRASIFETSRCTVRCRAGFADCALDILEIPFSAVSTPVVGREGFFFLLSFFGMIAGSPSSRLDTFEFCGAAGSGADAKILALAWSALSRPDTLEVCAQEDSGADAKILALAWSTLSRLIVFEDRRAGFIFSGDCAFGCVLFCESCWVS